MSGTDTKPEWRCTRPEIYPRGPGAADTGVRNGHYITAATPEDAAERMRAKYPSETSFDLQRWNPDRDERVTRYTYTASGWVHYRAPHVKAS